MAFPDIGLSFENYKSFGAGLLGFNHLPDINVIVGRNNSGKSALIDILGFAVNPAEIPLHLHHASKPPRVVLTTPVPEKVLKNVFPPGTSGGPISGNHWEAAKEILDARIKFEVQAAGTHRLVEISKEIRGNKGLLVQQYQQLAQGIENPLKGRMFARVAADRNIMQEQVTTPPTIASNGQGFTSAIAQILNRFEHPTKLVADDVLTALNEIFVPDTSFTSIDVQQYGENGPWEIFLQEKGKDRIALSHSGSGLKTILLIVGSFIVQPYLAKKTISGSVFAFEEPENNLHPALQRRLLAFAARKVRETKSLLFLTTHSNVIIDYFSRDHDAQVVHVTHAEGKSSIRFVQTYVENRGVLDDLDVRASDLLQANGIVWVEGPSDRLYFNRWIELLTDGELQEGSHYQCVFYGGRLLAHLSAQDPNDDVADAVKILRINRNAIVVIDSDKSDDTKIINATKQRIVDEINGMDGMAWVTEGREVENYLPLDAVKALYSAASEPVSKFEDFAGYLERVVPGEGNRFKQNKVLFAEKVIPALKKDTLGAHDLVAQTRNAIARIRKWNGLS